jgi:DNA-binding IclR family transcriptional regulator
MLDALSRRGRLTTAAIVEECAIPRSSAHTVLSALRRRGFVTYDGRDRRWGLGARAFEIGGAASGIEAGSQVLDSFDRRVTRQSAAQVAERTGLDLLTVEGVASSLARNGLLESHPDGTFSLGLRIVQLAAKVEPAMHLRSVAGPFLNALRDNTGETANLLVRHDDLVVFLEQVESPRALRHSGWAGLSVPVAKTAAGAALSGEPGLHKSANAVEPGISAVACSIPWVGPYPIAVSVTGPTFRFTGSALRTIEREVESAASGIASTLAGE